MPNVNTLLHERVVLKCEFVDRIFLNGYVARLQEPDDLAWFLCQHRGQEIPRYELLGEITRSLVAEVAALAEKKGIPIVRFEKRQRKTPRNASSSSTSSLISGCSTPLGNGPRPTSGSRRRS